MDRKGVIVVRGLMWLVCNSMVRWVGLGCVVLWGRWVLAGSYVVGW